MGAAGTTALLGRTALRSGFLRAAVILAAALVGGLIGLARADAGSSEYQATSLYASTVDGPSAGVILNSYATLLASESFRDQLATVTGEELDETSLVISVPASTGLISATVRAPTPEQVLAISEQVLPTFQVLAVETGPEVDPGDALIDVFGGPSAPEQDAPSRIWPVVAGGIAGLALGILTVVLWPSGRPRGVPGLGPAEDASGIPFRAAVPDLHDSDRSTTCQSSRRGLCAAASRDRPLVATTRRAHPDPADRAGPPRARAGPRPGRRGRARRQPSRARRRRPRAGRTQPARRPRGPPRHHRRPGQPRPYRGHAHHCQR